MMNLTLLPHQVLILPESYKDAMSKEFLEKFKVYNNVDIRSAD